MDFKEIYGYRVSECGTVLGKRGKPLIPFDNGRGYGIVSLLVGGKVLTKAVHRLVAEAWVENPKALPEVNHKDCDKWNNRAGNLEWCTRGYNIKYAYDNQGRTARGESNAKCKTTEDVVRAICERLSHGKSAADIRDEGFDYGLVRAVKAKRNWKHISKDYVW